MGRRKPKIDRAELQRMLDDGETVTAIARHFNVSKAAVTQAKKRLGATGVAAIMLDADPASRQIQQREQERAVAEILTWTDQLQRCSSKMLELLEKDDSDQITIQAANQIRLILETSAKIVEQMHRADQVQLLISEMASILDEYEPGIRQSILTRLSDRLRARQPVVEIRSVGQ